MGATLEAAGALLEMLGTGITLAATLETAEALLDAEETLLDTLDVGVALTAAAETEETLLETFEADIEATWELETAAELLLGSSGFTARLLTPALERFSLAKSDVFSLLPLPPHALKTAAKEIANMSLEKAGKADSCIRASCK